MAMFPRRRTADDLANLHRQFDDLRSELRHLHGEHTNLQAAHRELHDAHGTRAGEAEQRLAHVEHVIADVERRVGTLHDKLGTLGSELTNQFAELSGEIDALAEQSKRTDRALADDDWEDLRASHQRLVAEQVRYQIAFRKDLAALADRLRQQPPAR